MIKENICAISTPLGVGGISIIRVSGNTCIDTLNKYFTKPIINQEANTIKYNKFTYLGEILDEVMVSVFKNPHSYTGEDIIEINCHGGIYITNKILEILISDEEIRLANPGEFSKIAFLNGKKNLIEIDSIINTIEAKNETNYNLTNNQVVEYTKNEINQLRERLLNIITSIEVKLDYPEYQDLEEVIGSDIIDELETINNLLVQIIDNSNKGAIISQGLTTVIVGAPNVGKSSLLNRLSKQDKAIVSDVQGTTRDVVESEVNLGKIVLCLLDTAGIRETDEVVEQIGVIKSKELINEAQLVLFVIDKNNDFNKELQDLYELIKTKPHLVLINKCDDNQNVSFGLDNELCISVTTNYNIDTIQERVLELFNINNFSTENKSILINTLQIANLQSAKNYLEQAINNINLGLDIDVVEIDLKQSLYILGEILGINAKDDLLNALFSRYCLGK